VSLATLVASSQPSMIKNNIATELRREIITGRIEPGEAIVEGKWAVKFGVAQSSIRAALNILESQGFVERGLGRSMRVTSISQEDIDQIFQVRMALESLSARLVAQLQPDLTELDQIVADMRSAVDCRNLQAFFERDLRFHLTLCRLSENQVLEQFLQRLLLPLFAFVIMRTHDKMDEESRWRGSIAKHERIVAVLRSGDPSLAEREVTNVTNDFFIDINELTLRKTQLGKQGTSGVAS
jgi:DNA-binding GntR family transcriptional regulator